MSASTCLRICLCVLTTAAAAWAGASALPDAPAEGGKDMKAVTPDAGMAFTNSIGMKLVPVPPGKFKMGSPKDEANRLAEEEQHEVEITRPFYIGAFEVTQKQWQAVTGKNPSHFSKNGPGAASVQGLDTDDFPVELVSWDDIQEFLKKLNALASEKRYGVVYRLPTEAEWEYACRGGPSSSDKPFHFKDPSASLSSKQANFDGNSPYGGAAVGPYLGRSCKVGSYEPNRLGIHDMHGNIWEWVHDWHDRDYYTKSPKKDPQGPAAGANKVIRGGCVSNAGWYCRAANRYPHGPTQRAWVGFRVAASLAGR